MARMTGAEEAVRIIERATVRLSDSGLAALRRQAWTPSGAVLPLASLRAAAFALPSGIELETGSLDGATVFPSGHGRVVLNLLLLAAEALPEGGTIAIAGDAADCFFRIGGPRAAWPADFAAMMQEPDIARTALSSETGLQAGLTALLTREAGLRLSMVIPPTRQPAPPIIRLTPQN